MSSSLSLAEETSLLHALRTENDTRNARSREIVGSVYFCIALGMVLYALLLAVLQAWAIPTRRLQKYLPFGAKTEAGTVYHWIVLSIIYFGVTAGGGFSGYLVVTFIYLCMFVGMLIFSCLHRRKLKQNSAEAATKMQAVEVQPSSDGEIIRDDGDLNGAMTSTVPTSPPGGLAASTGPEEQSPSDEMNLAVVAPGQVVDQDGRVVDSMREQTRQRGGTDSSANTPIRRRSRRGADNDEMEGSIKLISSDDAASSVWLSHPYPTTNSQLRCVALVWLALLLLFAVILGLTLGFTVPDYRLMAGYTGTEGNYTASNPNGVSTAVATSEFQPKLTATALAVMYAFPRVATNLRLGLYVQVLSDICGSTFTEALDTDEEREAEIEVKWVERYSINMTLFVRNSSLEYSSVNDWFIRAIKLDQYRPLPSVSTSTELANLVVSPADCRLLVFSVVSDSSVWVKNAVVSANELVGPELAGSPGATYYDYWEKGSMVIARLAPQDYHRFHSPVSGVVESITELGDTLWSVSADAARSENYAFLNKRKVVVIDGGNSVGKVAYIAIGATCVGSVLLQRADGTSLKVGDGITIGEQLGIMQFGGSTVIVLFAQGRVVYNDRLLQRSQYPVETLVEVNQKIGGIGVI